MRSSGPLKTFSFDLMRVRPIRVLVGWAGFPYVFQAAMLFAFFALAVLSWGGTAPNCVPDKLYAKTHLVQLLIWGLWWPGMVWAAVVLGRVWCAVCPLEFAANVSGRVGRRLGIGQRPSPPRARHRVRYSGGAPGRPGDGSSSGPGDPRPRHGSRLPRPRLGELVPPSVPHSLAAVALTGSIRVAHRVFEPRNR